ncbi:MAG TPA: DUF3105 domain-containing protein [Gaiellaceae bacterium]|nr:DUF3105 domain-containing protein [Gaiellaceae bacterium]
MAKNKPRTPTPPRVQAPQQRRNDDMGMQHRKILYAVAAAGIVGLVAVVLLVAFGGGSNKTNDAAVAAAMTGAGCSYKTVDAFVPKGQSTHVNSLTANDHWNTSPPSNGQHYPEWDVWGFWTQTQNPRRVVHNEEHGGVIIWWGSQVSAPTVAKLRAFYLQQPEGVLGTPYPSLGSKIAVTAWTGNPSDYQRNGYYGFGHIGICSGFTPKAEAAFTKFRDTYRGKGPEGIPLCDDEPGDTPQSGSC